MNPLFLFLFVVIFSFSHLFAQSDKKTVSSSEEKLAPIFYLSSSSSDLGFDPQLMMNPSSIEESVSTLKRVLGITKRENSISVTSIVSQDVRGFPCSLVTNVSSEHSVNPSVECATELTNSEHGADDTLQEEQSSEEAEIDDICQKSEEVSVAAQAALDEAQNQNYNGQWYMKPVLEEMVSKKLKDSDWNQYTPNPRGDLMTMEGGYLFPSIGGGIYNGRRYAQHALERMAPETSEIMKMLVSRAIKSAQRKGFKFDVDSFQSCAHQPADLKAWWKVHCSKEQGVVDPFKLWWNQYGPHPRGVLPSEVEAEIANPGTTDVSVITKNNGIVITVIRKERKVQDRQQQSYFEESNIYYARKKHCGFSSKNQTTFREDFSENFQEDVENENSEEVEPCFSYNKRLAKCFEAKITEDSRIEISTLPWYNLRHENIKKFEAQRKCDLSNKVNGSFFANNFENKFLRQYIDFKKDTQPKEIMTVKAYTAQKKKITRMVEMAKAIGENKRKADREAKVTMVRKLGIRWMNSEEERTQSIGERKQAVQSILTADDPEKSAQLLEMALEKMKKKGFKINKNIMRVRSGLGVKGKKKKTKGTNVSADYAVKKTMVCAEKKSCNGSSGFQIPIIFHNFLIKSKIFKIFCFFL
ncbi:MAG TPA: hypothetical protein VJK54_06205 [Chthoniobacterales bacterium]|nr:hypothetical protein [Chthoniobacterales bacterium]